MDKQQAIIENQVALFNLVSALFYEVTGVIPIVRIKTKNGAILTSPNLDDVIYQGEVSQNSVVHQKPIVKRLNPVSFVGVI